MPASDASYFIGINRNKRSLGLDLSRPEGQGVLLRLLEHADILIENYKPGAMEKWGLGYEAVLRERLPRLIHCRISGFGADGPMGGLPGYDAVIQAMCGMFSINGMPQADGGGPTRIGIPLVDLGTGLYAAIALLMALVERERSGQGQFIDMTLYDAGIALMHPHIPNYLLSGRLPGLTGNAHPNISPYDKFPTRTVDVFLAIGNDRAFARLCAELGAPELAADPRYRTNADRIANRAALTERLQALLAGPGRRGALHAPVGRGRAGRAGARRRAGLVGRPHPPPRHGGRGRRLSRLGPADQVLPHAGRDRTHAAALRRARPRGPGRVRLRRGRDRPPGGVRRAGRAAPALITSGRSPRD